jgi:hypothetical protein
MKLEQELFSREKGSLCQAFLKPILQGPEPAPSMTASACGSTNASLRAWVRDCWKSLRSCFFASQEIVQKTCNGCG